MTDAPPVDRAAFAAAMAALGPFESHPHIACAVSGGADSMALAVLAEAWARERDGRMTALIVDHALRTESAAEARAVMEALSRLGIAAEILVRDGGRPTSNLQARAREDRYRLLAERCGAAGVLHLLLGHHRDDQAETFLLRLGRGSGGDGLAGMAAIVERPDVRLLRPLLGFSKTSLAATCRAAGVTWIEDPSNRDDAFARVRVRRLLPSLAEAGLDAAGLAEAASRFARVRVALEASTARLLARAAHVHPTGFALLDRRLLRASSAEIAIRAIGSIVRAVGGGVYAPGIEAIERLSAKAVAEGEVSATLGGCRIADTARGLLVCREVRRPGPKAIPAGPGRHVWDGRFELELAPEAGMSSGALRITHLGTVGWREIVHTAPELQGFPLPKPVFAALPALVDDAGIACVPHLGYRRPGPGFGLGVAGVRFRPANAAAQAGFFIVAHVAN